MSVSPVGERASGRPGGKVFFEQRTSVLSRCGRGEERGPGTTDTVLERAQEPEANPERQQRAV